MRDILARMLRGCYECRACRSTFPFSLPRAYLIGRPAVCCGVYCSPIVRVSCRSPNFTSPTRTTYCGHVASILVASSSDTSDKPDFIVTYYWHPRQDVTRMLRGCYVETAPMEFHLYYTQNHPRFASWHPYSCKRVVNVCMLRVHI